MKTQLISVLIAAAITPALANAKDNLPRPNFACAMRKATKSERGTGIRERRICSAMDRSYEGLKSAGSVPRDVDLNCRSIVKNHGVSTSYLKAVSLEKLPKFLTSNINAKKVLAAYTNGVDTLVLYKPKKPDSKIFEADGFNGSLQFLSDHAERNSDGTSYDMPAEMETSSFDCILLDLVSDVEEPGVG